MPELPEVETTKTALAPVANGQIIKSLIVRQTKLRYLIPAEIQQLVEGQVIQAVERRAKYLLIYLTHGCLISHLGMSGSWRILPSAKPAQKHDHLDIVLNSGVTLRYHDPRRFGCFIWTANPSQHPLITKLGIEPLDAAFNARYLFQLAKGKKTAIKLFIMDNANIVGVGNIYANEVLFLTGINPTRAASSLKLKQCAALVVNIKQTLQRAIKQGGTTLRDFSSGEGAAGHFQQQLLVYSRAGKKCVQCSDTIQTIRQGQRASFFCPSCQK